MDVLEAVKGFSEVLNLILPLFLIDFAVYFIYVFFFRVWDAF